VTRIVLPGELFAHFAIALKLSAFGFALPFAGIGPLAFLLPPKTGVTTYPERGIPRPTFSLSKKPLHLAMGSFRRCRSFITEQGRNGDG